MGMIALEYHHFITPNKMDLEQAVLKTWSEHPCRSPKPFLSKNLQSQNDLQ